MENSSFRCHFSIVFENLGSAFWTVLGLFILNVDDMGDLVNEVLSGNVKVTEALIIFGIFFAVMLLFFGFHVIVWAKTWISVDGEAVIIEKRTLNRKKNTIGMKNIANINTEQNVFERIMGTCKVKLDTNSQSTANSTDVRIVLKKDKAEEFKQLVMAHMNGEAARETAEELAEDDYDVAYTLKDVVLHCLYTVSLFHAGLLLVFLIGAVVGIHSLRVGDIVIDGIVNVIGGLVTLAIILLTAIRGLIRDFVAYYNFRAKRNGDKIYMAYGLLKKRNYVLSVDKINAIKVISPVVSRLFGRQYVEVICVGVGDEENEKSILLLTETKKAMKEKLALLLPEFTLEEKKMTRRKLHTLWSEITGFAIIVVSTTAAFVCFCVLDLAEIEDFTIRMFLGIFILLVVVWCLASAFLQFRTEGVCVGEEALVVSSGGFAKRIIWIPYRKIQNMKYSQGPLARHFGYAKGMVVILAGIGNAIHDISCFDVVVYRQIQEKILKRNAK